MTVEEKLQTEVITTEQAIYCLQHIEDVDGDKCDDCPYVDVCSEKGIMEKIAQMAIKALEENEGLKATDKRNKELFIQIKHQLDELSKCTDNWKDKLIMQSYIKPLAYLVNRYVNDNDKTLFFNGLEKDCQQLQDRLFEYNQKNNSLIAENKRLQEENDQLKAGGDCCNVGSCGDTTPKNSKVADENKESDDVKQQLIEDANENIETLVENMVCYMQGYVGSANCPYKYKLLGADMMQKPDKCVDCESCKEHFYEMVEKNLLMDYMVKGDNEDAD